MQIHERERVLPVIAPAKAQRDQSLVGHVLEVSAHVPRRQPGDAAGQQVFGEGELAGDGLIHHRVDLGRQLGVEQTGLFVAYGADDLEGERHVGALVAEDPAGAGGEAVQQAA